MACWAAAHLVFHKHHGVVDGCALCLKADLHAHRDKHLAGLFTSMSDAWNTTEAHHHASATDVSLTRKEVAAHDPHGQA